MDTILLCLPIGVIKGLIDGDITEIPWVIRHHLKPPFKVYVYCSNLETFMVKGIPPRLFHIKEENSAPYISRGIPKNSPNNFHFETINGKVALVFICDKTIEYGRGQLPPFNYSWHVSGLAVLDKPLLLSQLRYRCPNKRGRCGKCKYKLNDSPLELVRCGANITQAPTPWCHIREI